MTRMASVYAPLDSLVPVASRVRRRGSQDLGRRECLAKGGLFNHGDGAWRVRIPSRSLTLGPNRGLYPHIPSFQPAERAVLGRAARSSAQARQAAGASLSASQIPMAVLVGLAGEEANAKKVCINPPSMVPDPESQPKVDPNPYSGPDLHTKPSTAPCSPNQCPLHPTC